MVFVKAGWLDGATTPQVSTVEDLVGLYRFGIEVEASGDPYFVLKVQGTINGTYWRDLLQISGAGIYYSAADTPYPIRGLRLNLSEITPAAGPLTASLIAAEAQR